MGFIYHLAQALWVAHTQTWGYDLATTCKGGGEGGGVPPAADIPKLY